MTLRAGFIGLGRIGAPMARRLVTGGFGTTVYDIVEKQLASLVEHGAKRASSPRDVASACDIVGVCVHNDQQVKDVVLGADGILEGAHPGSVVALHSTILPSTVEYVASMAAQAGVAVVDACVTGGPFGAEEGRLTYMVGGEAEHLEKCRPAFESSAAKIVHTGKLGTGAATKLCNNLMTYLGFLSAFEATLLARSSGLSLDAMQEVTRSNGNLNDQMVAYLGLPLAPAERRAEPEFQGMVRSFTELAEKDLAVTLQFARENGVSLPGTALCQQLMARVYGLDDPGRR